MSIDLGLTRTLVIFVLVAAILLLGRWLRLFDFLWRHGVLLESLRYFPGAVRRARALQDHLAYPTVVPAGPGGMPAARFIGPSESGMTGRIANDGARYDCLIQVGQRSHVLVWCLGRAEVVGEVWALSRRTCTLAHFGRVLDPVASTMAGLPAVTYTVTAGDRWLTEWRFEREGWAFVAGYLRPPHGSPLADRLARETLASWTWLDGEAAPPTAGP